ncbi:MAG: hypothetical protein AAFV29_09800, partial [Myxococcota bacterium]
MMFTALVAAALVTGQTEPSPSDVKTVIDYYYGGSKMVLFNAYLCKTIEKKDKDTKNDCKETFGSTADKGERAYVYLSAMVPRTMKSNVMIQASHNGVVRATKDIVLAGNWIRSRAWRGFTLRKPG